MEVSWGTEIYPAVPSPTLVEVNAGISKTDCVVDVSCVIEMYPAVPKPVTVDTRLRVEM